MKFLITTLLITTLVAAPVNDKVKIQWKADRQLTWDDFRGSPASSGSYVASTNSGISFSYSIGTRNGETMLDYTVRSNFYPEQSWYLPEAASTYILKHEQTHFDISELHARKLRKRLSAVEVTREVKSTIDYLYSEVEKERREMQAEYDRQSDHSKIREAEYEWRDYIAAELRRYDAWQ